VSAPRLLIFGYGSLMRDPELPEAVLEGFAARLDGMRRSFNKRSVARGSWARESFADHPAASAALRRPDGFCESLVLGTERAPDAALVGFVHVYPARARDALFARLDAREGFDPEGDPLDNGYLRREVTVRRLDGGASVRVTAYLTHEEPRNRWLIDPETPRDERARILIAATPTVAAPRPRGLDYLMDSMKALAGRGLRDPELDALVAAARAHDGPWLSRLAG